MVLRLKRLNSVNYEPGLDWYGYILKEYSSEVIQKENKPLKKIPHSDIILYMLIRNRPDGIPAKVPGYTKMLPILMPTRTESAIYMDQVVKMDNTMEFLGKWNDSIPEGRLKLTMMQVLLTAMARTVAQRPALNRFVSNYRHYQRNNISISFVTKKRLSDDGAETNVIMPFRPFDTLDDVNERFTRFIGEAKSNEGNKTDGDVDSFEKLPIWVLRAFIGLYKFLDRHNWISPTMLQLLPFYSTAFLTNVGSIKLDAPFHHNFEMGNCGIFIALGKIRFEKFIDKDDQIRERKVVDIRYTFDDRIVDGIYSGRAMKLLKDYIEHPEKLVEKPSIDPKYIEELALSEKGWKLWAMK